jgi:hypothetical protein
MSGSDENATDVDARKRKRARFDAQPGSSHGKRSTFLVAGVAAIIVLTSAFFLLKGGDTNTTVERTTNAGPPADGPARRQTGATSGASGQYATAIAPQGDDVRIPAADLSTEARFFAMTAGTTRVPFFAVRDAAGRVHVALDACQVCAAAKKGYVQEGDHMMCRNCGQSFRIAMITEMSGEGGCHPISIPSTVAGDVIVVKTSDVAAGAKWF